MLENAAVFELQLEEPIEVPVFCVRCLSEPLSRANQLAKRALDEAEVVIAVSDSEAFDEGLVGLQGEIPEGPVFAVASERLEKVELSVQVLHFALQHVVLVEGLRKTVEAEHALGQHSLVRQRPVEDHLSLVISHPRTVARYYFGIEDLADALQTKHFVFPKEIQDVVESKTLN